VRVREIPNFDIGIAFQYTLLQLRYLVEAVHVELSDERLKVLVLEPPTKNLAREMLRIWDCELK
jgi:hypothetical protein